MSKKLQRYDASWVRSRLTRRSKITHAAPRAMVPLLDPKVAEKHAKAFDAVIAGRPDKPPGRSNG